MRCDEVSGTLIRYAGSASKASTDSRPIGSELSGDMCTLPPRCQVFPNGSGDLSRGRGTSEAPDDL